MSDLKKFIAKRPYIRTLFIFAANFLIILIIISASYYFLWLKPAVDAVKNLTLAKGVLIGENQLLQQERVAYTGLLRLDPNKLNFSEEKNDLMQRSLDAQKKILDPKGNKVDIKSVGGKDTKKLLNEIIKGIPDLETKGRDVAGSKKEIMDNYYKLDSIVAKIYEYDPRDDLLSLDFSSDHEKLGERSSVASESLKNIAEKVKKSNFTDYKITNTFYEEISKNISLFDTITFAAQKKNLSEFNKVVNDLIRRYPFLKKETKKITDSVLKTAAAEDMLLSQTNLILKYEFYISEIDKEQAKINTDPISVVSAKFRGFEEHLNLKK